MKTNKNIFEIFILLVALIISINYLGFVLRPGDTDGAYSQIENYHSIPNNSIEVIVYGSSHAYRGFNVMKLYEDYGIAAYNYGYHWQKMNTTKLFIDDSLMTQNPKVIFIETFFADRVLKDVDMNPESYYARYIKNEEARKEYLKQCFGNDFEKYLAYYIPLYQFHENWSSLSADSFKKLEIDSIHVDNMGYYPTKTIKQIKIEDYHNFEQKQFPEIAIEELDSIVSLCRSKNIDIIFYTMPYEGEYNYSNAMKEYAERNGYKYFDLFALMDEVGLDPQKDYSDDAHLNISGSTKIANFFGKYLVENYSFTDMRSITNNPWEIAGRDAKK